MLSYLLSLISWRFFSQAIAKQVFHQSLELTAREVLAAYNPKM